MQFQLYNLVLKRPKLTKERILSGTRYIETAYFHLISSAIALNHKPTTFSDPFQNFFPRAPQAGPVLAKLPAPKRYDHSIKSPFTSWGALRYWP